MPLGRGPPPAPVAGNPDSPPSRDFAFTLGVVTGAGKQSLGTFFARHKSEIQSEFHTTVDEYLAVCRERGFPPISPIRSADPVPPSLRPRVAAARTTSGTNPEAVSETRRAFAKV